MKQWITGVLVLLASFVALPAVADSYALINFAPNGSDPENYTTPYASFIGGVEEGTSQKGYGYAAMGSEGEGIGVGISIAPNFPVHEVSFDLRYDTPISPGLLFIDGEDVLGGNLVAGSFGYAGISTIDFSSSDGRNIGAIQIYEGTYVPGSDLFLSNLQLNPSLASAAVSPEPPSIMLTLTAFLALLCTRSFVSRRRSGSLG